MESPRCACPRCDGSGVCVECHGDGSVNCPACEGRGRKRTPKGIEFDCKHCTGTGRVECSPRCSSCGGSGQLTDELRKEVREKYQVRWDNFSPLNRVTVLLLSSCLAIYAVPWLDGDWMGPLDRWCLNTASGWTSGEIWRLVSPMFLHTSWWHLGLNMWFLWTYGPVLEGLYGSRRFTFLYFFSGVAGNLSSWFGLCFLGLSSTAGVGASTALFGIIGSMLALHLRYGLFPRDEIRNWLVFLLGFVAVSFTGVLGGVDHWGHAGGALGGFLFSWFSARPRGR